MMQPNPAPRFLAPALVLLALPVVSLSTFGFGVSQPASIQAATDSSGEKEASAMFSMYCYWTGEATLGRQAGVLESAIGHHGGREIVQVTYDPEVTDLGTLARALEKQRSLYSVIVESPQEKHTVARSFDGDIQVVSGATHLIPSKHSLRTRHPDLYYLDLQESQAIALNSWSYFGGQRPRVLDAAQTERHQKLRARLDGGQRPPLDPTGARAGQALSRYRERLIAWLDNP